MDQSAELASAPGSVRSKSSSPNASTAALSAKPGGRPTIRRPRRPRGDPRGHLEHELVDAKTVSHGSQDVRSDAVVIAVVVLAVVVVAAAVARVVVVLQVEVLQVEVLQRTVRVRAAASARAP
jgi:hypothetical protein